MKLRIALSALVAVLLVVLFWFLLWQPMQDEVAVLDQDIEDVRAQQAQREARIAALRQVREQAPELHALITTSELLVPRTPGLPAAVRQLQLAAEESGLRLSSISPGRPTPVAGADAEPGRVLVSMSVSILAEGSYFQVVDFLRRVEDPSISPRGLVWTQVAASPVEHPTLSFSMTGQFFAVLPEGEVDETADEPDDEVDDPLEDDPLLDDEGDEE
jgi:Tfp pilus assembly protein PilO